ncbi:MAG: hypothetical protein EOP48_26330 [Sphingobacteriales bacterium]|nr:MAG: hypothetical protein EOP48_26330 [Sphingobacteriales bacterium]
MSDASPYGTLNVSFEKDSIKIIIHSISAIHDSLMVSYKGARLYDQLVKMEPSQIFETILLSKSFDRDSMVVDLGNGKLLYAPKQNMVERPIKASAKDTIYRSAQRYFRMGEEQNAMRNYSAAFALYQQSLLLEPGHYESLCRVAEYYYRSGDYEKGLSFARRVLEYDTYHGGGNYIFGNLLLKLDKFTEAEEAFSIASKTMEYRSAAFVQLAGINLRLSRFDEARTYAQQAISYNTKNIPALQVLATAYRKLNNKSQADLVLDLDSY